MSVISAIILGIIQGLTEFIPVSSTAHLLIGQKILDIPFSKFIFSFLVIVQLGTILSLLIYFWKDILSIVKSFFAKPFTTLENRLGWYIIIATIPALIAGYLLKDLVEALFSDPLLEAGIRLLLSAFLITLAEWLGKRNRELETMTWVDALVIGLTQIVAIFPGASRSGTTISAGLFLGLDRKSAARFAFLMSIPVMVAAGVYEMIDVVRMPGIGSYAPVLITGFITAAIVGWFAVKWLINFLESHSLYWFAVYCSIVGSTVLLIHFFTL